MKEHKKQYLFGALVVGLVVIVVLSFLFFNAKKETPQKALESYISALDKKDYPAMYAKVTTSLKKDEFTNRVKNIYEGIAMKNLKMEIGKCEEKEDGMNIHYKMQMDSIAGTIRYENTVFIVKKDGNYKLRWDSSQIFPNLENTGHVRVNTLSAQRGSILDRNGNALAKQGIVYKVGLVAGKMKDETASIQQLAKALDISEESITKALSASWVQEGLFVPVATLSESEIEQRTKASNALNEIDGATIQKSVARVYPYGEITAHLTGYIQNISQEELKKHQNEGYDTNSVIGKSGLEQVYEKNLKAEDGYEIVITNENEDIVDRLVKKDAKNGKDITTTIDMHAQKIVYQQLKGDAGAGVMLSASTGEVLAMVSTPSFDPNAFVVGIRGEQWNTYNNETTTPLLNRVTSLYPPGSTFKAITGAIGLDHQTITVDTTYKKTAQWQKDKSWGNNYVTTTHAYSEPSNLENAFKYSDNIFFAQLADQIGNSTYQKYLDKIGFQKKIDFPLSVEKSSYGKLDNDQKLAATGYGQGELMISPLHLSALYTAYKNEGTVLQPYLMYDEGKSKVLKKQAYSKESANTVFQDLQKTMNYYGDNPTQAAGKSGTAQIKNGEQEIGWLCAVNDKISLSLMINDTKEVGGSLYVIPKAQEILSTY